MSAAEPPSARLAGPEFDRPVVSVGDRQFGLADLVLVGFILGVWSGFERDIEDGLVCECAADLEAGPGGADALRAEAIAFRRAQGLLSGDQLRVWLDEHGLSHDGWVGCLRRLALRKRLAGRLDDIRARHSVSAEAIAAVLVGEAVCDGILRRCGMTLVAWATAQRLEVDRTAFSVAAQPERLAALGAEVAASAASRLLGLATDAVATRLECLLALQAAYERLVARVADASAIQGCLHEHRLDWLRFRYARLCFGDEDAAHEAAMCLREDGLEPTEVARLAGATLQDVTMLVEEAPPDLASLLVTAQPGDVLGPLAGETPGGCLLVVAERISPAQDDPILGERARQELVAVALQGGLAGLVRWHGQL